MGWFRNLFRAPHAKDIHENDKIEDIFSDHRPPEEPGWTPINDSEESDVPHFSGGGITHPNTEQTQSPRDSMLKNPESESHYFQDTGAPWIERTPHDPHSHFDPFSGHGGFFQMPFGHAFINLGDVFDMFGPHGFNEPPPNFLLGDPSTHEPRTDTDLDGSPGSSLLKDGPGYSRPSVESSTPFFSQNFKSTSIVRVKKPDGTIEEKRTYKDSTGREEETVTTYEGTNDTNIGSNAIELPDQNWSGLPSLFSLLMPRW